MLEKQLHQASTDKDAAYRTLLIQSTTRASSVETPDSSTAVADPIESGSGGSPLSFATSSVPSNLSTSPRTSAGQSLPLIDLLGPIDQVPKPSFESCRSSFNTRSSRRGVHDSIDRAHSNPPLFKSNAEPSDAESIAYIRRFSGRLQEPKLIVKETAHHAAAPQPENGICKARISDKMLHSSCSSPKDADSERCSPETADNSLNSSFTESQGSPDPAHIAIPKTNKMLPLHKSDRPQWAHSSALKTLSVALLSDERWEKYRQSITVKISGDFGFTCIDQVAYHTVMLYNLSVDCTMGDILGQVRGGMILDSALLDTTTITGFMTAMLTFVESSVAVAFTDYVGRHGLTVCNCVARAVLIRVPTARIRLGQIRAINSHFHSRCLSIRNLPLSITLEELRQDLRPSKATDIDLVESMSKNADDVLELRFLSVTAAEDAFCFITSRDGRAKYQQCRVVYGPDPCAQSWAGKG